MLRRATGHWAGTATVLPAADAVADADADADVKVGMAWPAEAELTALVEDTTAVGLSVACASR